jgi:hypothetical protein
VVASLVVKGDEEQRPSRIAKVIDSVVAARDRVLEGERDLIQTAIGDTETPDKVVDQGNVFLMRLSSKDNGGTPRSETFADPTVGFQNLELGHNNFAFVRSVMRLLAADRRGSASIDSEFKVEDGKRDTSAIKTVPV